MIVALKEFSIRLTKVEVIINKIEQRLEVIQVDTEEVREESTDARR
jgi:hypothetical protein